MTNDAYDLRYDANGVGADLVVETWISHSPRASDEAFDPQPGDWLVIGDRDGVVGLDRGLASRDALVALGCNVEWHDYPMEHSVSAEEVADLQRFLQRVLAR